MASEDDTGIVRELVDTIIKNVIAADQPSADAPAPAADAPAAPDTDGDSATTPDAVPSAPDAAANETSQQAPPAATQPRGLGLGLGLGLGSKPLPAKPAPAAAAAATPTPPTPAPPPAPAPTPDPAPPPAPTPPRTAGNLVDLTPPPAPHAAPVPHSRLTSLELLNDRLRAELLLLDSHLRLATARSALPPAELAAAQQLVALARSRMEAAGDGAGSVADLQLDVAQLRAEAQEKGLTELAETLAEFEDDTVPYPQLLAEVAGSGAGAAAEELEVEKGGADVSALLAEVDRLAKRQAAAELAVLRRAREQGDLLKLFEPVVLHRKQRNNPLRTLGCAIKALVLAPVKLPLGLLRRLSGLAPPRPAPLPEDKERVEFRVYCARVRVVSLYRQRVLRELETLAAEAAPV